MAFRATLEELESADLLVHVIDASNPVFEDQVRSVDSILAELDLTKIPCILVLNKQDIVEPQRLEVLQRKLCAVAISAKDSGTLMPLIEKMEAMIQAIPHPD